MQFSTVASVAFVALANFVAAESAAAISQITDGQIQATTTATTEATTTAAPSSTTAAPSSTVETVSPSSTETISQQTENGAAKAAVGMGAGALAAAAMLL
ncbi:CGH_3_HP_G0036510.mRNA.1.CDS.1 [Saccharomyces cerevisiae]|nr:CGH_3_HP_G0036510.mRNA.1.CDS.1 [Saccharomyces cerevisiae]CAI4955617.1 CGH_1_HP_G0041060.mRNA.1.CDS.1 [Saccharomyces cerevisiae]CAI5033523.1 CGH_1_HP_G0104320.mRNA.1.CDS.1 [Saccharomyces cerevisiae]CAI6517250.1 CGH_3_HP_G0036510.mRNA.1.CDS.1 [Saccharomyces cerevisiae]CAI6651696.1 CGH_1_HP_G0041060.mRNA.1.CDS.1 [Saccharomyces cerevisiae]